jgi:hypothetical protein
VIPVRQSCLTLPPLPPPIELDALPECAAGEKAGEGDCPVLTPELADAMERWASEQSTYAEDAWILCGPAADDAIKEP